MARRFREEINDWARGAITETSPDKVPLNASPRARNTAWVRLGLPAKRRGTSIITQEGEAPVSPATARPAILAIGHYDDIDWVISDQGRWSKIVDGEFEPIDSSNEDPFTSGTHIPSTVVANNLLFAVNGQDAVKTDGTDVTNFGITRPAAPTANTTLSGVMTGTYYIAQTYYNEDTGHESSMSDYATMTPTSDEIQVVCDTPSDPQVTHIRYHIFKEGLTSQFFQVVLSTTPAVDATGGFPVGTVAVEINLSDADINNLVILSPTTTENDPPPEGASALLYHGSRMWVTDGRDIFYSKIELPESFDLDERVESVNPDDGQLIVGFASISEDILLILKERSSYVLTGPNDPNTWEISELDLTVGCKALRTIIATEGEVWWEAEQGFFSVTPGEKPKRRDTPAIGDKNENISFLNLNTAVAAYDKLRQRILFAVPYDGVTRNTIILPFNKKLGIWEDVWDPMDISAMGTLFDAATGAPYVAIGNYKGRVFRLWDGAYVDGVRLVDDSNDPLTLTGNPTDGTTTILEDSGATFDTEGDGLAEIPIVVVSADGVTQRNVIASNTSTILLLQNSWGVVPDETWTYYIGCPNWEFDTKYMAPTSVPDTQGSVYNSRRFKRMLLKGVSDTGSATVTVYAIIDHEENSPATSMSVSLSGSGAQFDLDLFDVGVFGSEKAVAAHRTIGRSGKVCGLRVVNRDPGVGVVLLGIGLMGSELSYKL